ncbi:glycoside hydrolase family 113 [Bradyrhizobium sp. SZCCHNS2022]|uniref:glycoside hydrolase family 113 n=2 Tax=Bradyrhizobium TaxID=374 RepID=UPI003965724C
MRNRSMRLVIRSLVWGACASCLLDPALGRRLDGFNIVATPDHPFGSATAEQALSMAKRLGATSVAVIPFLWQSTPSAPDIVAGSAMSDEALRAAIQQARRLGLTVIVKPHVWVPDSWAGAVEPASEQDWKAWFARYQAELERIARIAADEGADVLAIGTELARTKRRAEWNAAIAAVRSAFPRTLLYVAHNADEAEAIAFWPLLDVIGVSLYPPLGADDDRGGRIAMMEAEARRLDVLSDRWGKPVLVAEIGLRSAKGAAAKPWESAEERAAPVDVQLQADVIADWLAVLKRPAVAGVLVWRWFTDPAAGGNADTDFTVQGKPAEAVLSCAWAGICRRP